MTDVSSVFGGTGTSPLKLRVPHTAAAALLTEQIRCGQQLEFSAIDRVEQLAHQQRVFTTWCEVTANMLRTVYSAEGPMQEFAAEAAAPTTATFAEGAQALRTRVKGRVARLESLLWRMNELEVDARDDGPKVMERAERTGRVLVVHGRDAGLVEQVVRVLMENGLEAVVLHDQPQGGREILGGIGAGEEFGFAVVVLTADEFGGPFDLGRAGDREMIPRAMQAVVLELGYLVGKMKRGRVMVLHKPGVELPGDCMGVLCVPTDGFGAWRARLVRELRGAGMVAGEKSKAM